MYINLGLSFHETLPLKNQPQESVFQKYVVMEMEVIFYLQNPIQHNSKPQGNLESTVLGNSTMQSMFLDHI